ncbi:MAG: pectinesterase family protein [Terriglobus sp.]
MRNVLALALLATALAAHAQNVTVLVRPGAKLNGPDVFPTIQNAIDHAPEPGPGGRVTIRITPGTYNERLWIPRNRPNLTLVGLGTPEDTVITSDHFAKTSGGTFFTQTVEVLGDGFHAANLTFANSAGNVGQAVAVAVLADKAIFKHCRFLGYQDTLFANWGRQFYTDDYIEGAVDYVFGNATAVFNKTEFYTVAPGYITAQSRLSESEPTGYVIRDSHLTFAPGADATAMTDNAAHKTAHGVFLGRPWRNYSRVLFINTQIDKGIDPAGWSDWNNGGILKTAFYAEINSTGPGASPTTRIPEARKLTPAQLKSFETRNILRGKDNWNPEQEATQLP